MDFLASLSFVLLRKFRGFRKSVTLKLQFSGLITGVFVKKGFCAIFEAKSLRRKFSGRLKMSHFATLSSQIHGPLCETEPTAS